jgi:heme/copper-type cytochrome/quinol oxidase subunit 3
MNIEYTKLSNEEKKLYKKALFKFRIGMLLYICSFIYVFILLLCTYIYSYIDKSIGENQLTELTFLCIVPGIIVFILGYYLVLFNEKKIREFKYKIKHRG